MKNNILYHKIYVKNNTPKKKERTEIIKQMILMCVLINWIISLPIILFKEKIDNITYFCWLFFYV